MDEFVACIVLLIFLLGVVFQYRGCEEDKHKFQSEKRAQCFEATKNHKCFVELDDNDVH